MTGPSPQSRFLDRRAYRQRRLRDAARMLPVAGFALWLVPLLWRAEPEAETSLSTGLTFVFGTWLLLILASWLLARRIALESDAPKGDPE